MDVHFNLKTWEFLKDLPSPTDFSIYFSVNSEIPCLRVKNGDRPVMQNWKFIGERLPRRQTPLTPHALFFFFTTEKTIQTGVPPNVYF
jgi:hypothetical protein